MVIAAAVGFWRMPAPRLRAASWFLGAYGAFVFAAAIFRADPVDGFLSARPRSADDDDYDGDAALRRGNAGIRVLRNQRILRSASAVAAE